MLPAIIGIGAKLGTAARLVGAGMRGGGGFTANRAIANEVVAANNVARANLRRDLANQRLTELAKQGGGAVSPAQMKASQRGANINMMVDEQLPRVGYQQAMQNIGVADKTAYGIGRGLGAVNQATAPIGGLANVGLTGAFLAPALLPQNLPEPMPTPGYSPMQNQFAAFPTPQGGQYPADVRGMEMMGGMGGLPMAPLNEEQITKAMRRNEEQAQLNAIYAQALSTFGSV